MPDDTVFRPRILSVAQMTAYVREVLERDRVLQNLWIRGEISDFKYYQKSGHMYFNLKDNEAAVNCVMFRGRTRGIDFLPENGLRVIARGYVSIFEKYGRYQFYVEEMEPDGPGALLLALNQLKERLDQEGLFDPRRKRRIPTLISCLGIVTSTDGAALRDIVRVVRQRHPRCNIVIAPASVQGQEAAGEIARAIADMNKWGKADVLIVGRGGGSLEDLWAFNTEQVVRAIAASAIPTISAVGHEVDFTLADLAADARAATPTQAAQMAVPEISALRNQLDQLTRAMKKCVERQYNLKWAEIDYLKARRLWQRPGVLVEYRREKTESAAQALLQAAQENLRLREQSLAKSAVALDALSPLKVLERGYAVARKLDGEVLKDAGQVERDELIELILSRGSLWARVLEKW
jgi:exodeoxyribonuclease VII large subunit